MQETIETTVDVIEETAGPVGKKPFFFFYIDKSMRRYILQMGLISLVLISPIIETLIMSFTIWCLASKKLVAGGMGCCVHSCVSKCAAGIGGIFSIRV